MYYQIYGTQTWDLLLDAETLTEAPEIVRATIGTRGVEAVTTWLPIEDDESDAGHGRRIAAGEELARLAAHTPSEASVSHDD